MATKSDLKDKKAKLEDKVNYLKAEKKKYITEKLIVELREAEAELEKVNEVLKSASKNTKKQDKDKKSEKKK